MHTFALVLLRHFPVRHFPVCHFPVLQIPVTRFLDTDSAAAMVHAVVTSRLDYCNTLLAGASKPITDKLQRVLTAAARVVSYTLGLCWTTGLTGWTTGGCNSNCVQRSTDVCNKRHHAT